MSKRGRSGEPQASWRGRVALPRTTGRRRLLVAWLIDALGSGMFLPFIVIYFLATTSVPLAAIGGALSAGALFALPAPLVIGQLVDRFGAKTMVVLGNMTEAVAFAAALWIGTAWQITAFAFLVNGGRVMFWIGNQALVAMAADHGQRARWFGLGNSVRSAGAAVGSLLAVLALAGFGDSGYRVLAGVNAASFLVSAILVWSWGPAAGDGKTSSDEEGPSDESNRSDLAARRGYLRVLSDLRYVLLIGTNTVYVLGELALEVLLAIYITQILQLPVWWAGVLYTFKTILIVLAQTTMVGATEKRLPARVLRAAALLFALAFLALWGLAGVPADFVVIGLFGAITCHTAALLMEDPVVRDVAIAVAPQGLRGRYLAVYQYSWSLSEFVAPASLTWLFSKDPGLPWIALVVGCIAAFAAAGPSVRRMPATRNSPPLEKS